MPTNPDEAAFEGAFGPDPSAPYRREATALLGVADDPGWHDAIDAMIATVRYAIREDENQERREHTKGRLEELAKAARTFIKLKGHDDVRAALRVLAPQRPKEIDGITGYEYLVQMAARAERANAKIRTGKGRDTLGASLGRASPRLLCAVLVVKALHAADGRSPSEKNERALRLCDAIWRAAGGGAVGGTDTDDGRGTGAWPRNIRAAKLAGLPANSADWSAADRMTASAILTARRTAADCLRHVQRK